MIKTFQVCCAKTFSQGPVMPAKAGIHTLGLDSRFRGSDGWVARLGAARLGAAV